MQLDSACGGANAVITCCNWHKDNGNWDKEDIGKYWPDPGPLLEDNGKKSYEKYEDGEYPKENAYWYGSWYDYVKDHHEEIGDDGWLADHTYL